MLKQLYSNAFFPDPTKADQAKKKAAFVYIQPRASRPPIAAKIETIKQATRDFAEDLAETLNLPPDEVVKHIAAALASF